MLPNFISFLPGLTWLYLVFSWYNWLGAGLIDSRVVALWNRISSADLKRSSGSVDRSGRRFLFVSPPPAVPRRRESSGPYRSVIGFDCYFSFFFGFSFPFFFSLRFSFLLLLPNFSPACVSPASSRFAFLDVSMRFDGSAIFFFCLNLSRNFPFYAQIRRRFYFFSTNRMLNRFRRRSTREKVPSLAANKKNSVKLGKGFTWPGGWADRRRRRRRRWRRRRRRARRTKAAGVAAHLGRRLRRQKKKREIL